MVVQSSYISGVGGKNLRLRYTRSQEAGKPTAPCRICTTRELFSRATMGCGSSRTDNDHSRHIDILSIQDISLCDIEPLVAQPCREQPARLIAQTMHICAEFGAITFSPTRVLPAKPELHTARASRLVAGTLKNCSPSSKISI
jgi:hypothetical protein